MKRTLKLWLGVSFLVVAAAEAPVVYMMAAGARGEEAGAEALGARNVGLAAAAVAAGAGVVLSVVAGLLLFRESRRQEGGHRTLEKKLEELTEKLRMVEREQTTRLEQERLSALQEISAGLAHEIRNPLSAILSGISLLESGRRTEEERAHILKLMRREAARLNAALTHFLLFARPQRPHKVRLDLALLLREMVQMIEEEPELKGQVEIRLELEDLPAVWFDDDQLRQLLWQVILNALQAMNGSGQLTLRTRDLRDGWWRVEIQDTGPGIPLELMKKIYDPFFSTKKGCSGLGLAIAKRIIREHGGTLTSENLSPGGCRFLISAPFLHPETGEEK